MDYRYPLMAGELVDWFNERAEQAYGGVQCEDILLKHPDKRVCGQIVTETYNMAMEILTAQGFDPGKAKSD
jgi:hypothetical protein